MKKELLSPVGSVEALYQAVHNGADAVYLGGKKFGARMFADNFTKEDLVHAINYCHLYNVKIYVTVNTVIFDNEVKDFIDYIEFLYVHGVDAVIMQDIGMISLVKEKFPELEIHASTQSHNHNSEGIKLLKQLGVSRIVLARELSLDEVKSIDVDIEKEIFIHGALCVCYSGCCLFSSMNSSRSGNRGECVASCRLPYQLFKNDKLVQTNGNYLLSMRELNTSNYLKDILESDVVSLKIEGRMKSPEYVGFITKFYRTLIDKYYNKEEMTIKEADLNELKTLFNREFTNGYLFNEYGRDVMNIKNQNHIGLEIGKVVEVDSKYIKIKLKHELNQEDGIKFLDVDKGMIVNKLYNSKLMLVNKVEKGNIAIVDNKIGLNILSKVSVTTNKLLLEKLNKYIEKKLDISFLVVAKKNANLEIVADDGFNKVKVEGNKVLKSINRPVTIDNITNQLSKLGNTPFKLKNINIDMDNDIFISLKEINDLRRDLVDKLIQLKTKVPNKQINQIKNKNYVIVNKKVKISALVRNEEQLLCCLEQGVDYIYVCDIVLFNKYKNYKNIYLRLDRVMHNFIDYKNKNLLVCELGALNKYKTHNDVCTDYYLNINNNYSVQFLERLGVNRICLSPETTNFNNICSNVDIEMIVYGRLELMITKYCPLNMILNKDNKNCNLCLNKDEFYLKDDQNHIYPLIHSKHFTHIMHHKNINLINNVNDYKNKGINCFRLELFNEDRVHIIELINKLRSAL